MKIEITQEKLDLIIQSLLFSSTSDISANWSEENNLMMIELAIKLYKKNNLENISICKQINSENYFSYKKIVNNFNIKIN